MFHKKVNNLKRQAEEQFYNNLEIAISDFQVKDKNNFGRLSDNRKVKGNSSSSSVPPLKSFPVNDQNDFCFSSEEKAELLNVYFTCISTVNDENVSLPALEFEC